MKLHLIPANQKPLVRLGLIATLTLAFTTIGQAQTAKPVKLSFKVAGNCEHCQERIESVLDKKGVKHVKWSPKTQLATIMADTTVISVSAMQQLVAATGHDTPPFRGNDAAYAKLPGCCRYDRLAIQEAKSESAK